MNKIFEVAARGVSKAGFAIRKHSPEILLVGGIAAGVAATVFACKSTLKVEEVVEKAKKNIHLVHETHDSDLVSDEEYSELDYKRDLTICYAQAAKDMIKLYAPTIALGALSITCVCASTGILRKRNVALTGAYNALNGAFRAYRTRVKEELGEEADKRYRFGAKEVEIKETKVDKDGKSKTVKTKELVVDELAGYSDYAKFFDESCKEWEKDPEYNLMFLKAQQSYANDILRAKGHLFLNEVYDMLGIERTRAGQCVGWVYKPDDPTRDNYVDFGIYNQASKAARNFVNGFERVILLDFNVDGPILDDIWTKTKQPSFRPAEA